MFSTASTAGLQAEVFEAFRAPISVAVVGASQDPSKWGHWVAKGALLGTKKRSVYLVNKNGAAVAGNRTYPSLSQLPEVPELVVIVLPGHQVYSAVAEALSMGSRAFLVISARVPKERELKPLLDHYGARMIGPNSLGMFVGESRLQLMWGEMQAGSLAVVSQSGQLGSEIAALGRRVGIGISRFVSLGNQVDVHAVDVILSVADDPSTKTLGIYMEDFSRGEEIFEAISEVRKQGIAVALLTTGASDASRDLAQSHTGAMTSATELVDAACRASGSVRVATPSEVVRIAEVVEKGVVPQGLNIAIVSDSGGQGGIAADEATRRGLVVPELSGRLRERIADLLPEGASTRNPIDLAGAGEADLGVYAQLTDLLQRSGEVDGVVLSGYFGSYGHDTPALLDRELRVAAQMSNAGDVPVLIHAMEAHSVVAQRLRERNIVVSVHIEHVISAMSGSYYATRPPRKKAANPDVRGIPAVSDPALLRATLSRNGIAFPEMRIVRTEEEVIEAVAELGQVLVLKAAWLAHKTEQDGVRLGLVGVEATLVAFREMRQRLGNGNYTLEVQDLRQHVAEYIVSVRRDAGFGVVTTVGYGGTETEVWGDLVMELGPVSVDEVERMLRQLRSAPLLGVWRGRDALDIQSLAELVSRLSYILARSPEIREIEINPVRVGIDGALAVDCLAFVSSKVSHSPPPTLDLNK